MEVIGTRTRDNLIAGDMDIDTDEVTLALNQTLARGAAIGIVRLGAVSSVPNGGNTGDGTNTALATVLGEIAALVGAYNLECIEAGSGGVAAGTITPDGGNTGDGTVTALAISALMTPKVGSFELECTDADSGGTSSATTAQGGGDTGNGTASAVTVGGSTIEGVYAVTCTDASVSGSEIFQVFDPNGVRLEDMTVGVAYLNEHFGMTLTDGSTDFIVGDSWDVTAVIAHGGKFKLTDPAGNITADDLTLPGGALGTLAIDSGGITMTLTDGATDFAVGDKFVMTVTATELGGGTFKLVDPLGALVTTGLIMTGGAGVATIFEAGGLTFTLTDGATDFIVGDKFAITVAIGSLEGKEVDATAVDGTQHLDSILAEATTVGAVSTVVAPVYKTGQFNEDEITFASGTVAAYKDAARLLGIFFKPAVPQ